jgi:hypothetical protein
MGKVVHIGISREEHGIVFNAGPPHSDIIEV